MTQYLLSVWMVDGDPIPSEDVIQTMYADADKFNEEVKSAGAWVFAGGLHPADTATVVKAADGDVVTTDGPFAESKELVAGYWLWQVNSMDEAVEWLKRAPFQEGEVELRQVFEEEDFGEELTPELREQERRLREQTEKNQ